jgi:hypothetical protein
MVGLLEGQQSMIISGEDTKQVTLLMIYLRSDIVCYQKSGYGLRGSMTLEKKYKKVIFEGGPFIRYWNINKLKPTIVPNNVLWQEPGNNSREVGVKLAVKF